jgi:aspartate/methionine/tyrosine aminotransferase
MASSLSSRAKPFLAGSTNANSYGNIHVSLLSDTYDQKSNPQGAILMSIAENKLCGDLLLDRINSHKPLSSNILNYTDGTGLPTFKRVMADFLTEHVFKLHSGKGTGENANGNANKYVQPGQLVISAGCTGLLFQLSVLLFEKGDSILIPTPYYPAFDADFGNLGGAFRISIDPTHPQYNLQREDLDRAYQRALDEGHPPKAVLVSNPHNPLGKVYTPAEILMTVQWCRDHRIHLICDEIYALSVFNSNTADGPFHSVVALLDNDLGDYVHVLWGVSKDLGASGLRVGVLYSHNQALLPAITGLQTAFQVSNVVQEVVQEMLADRTFIDHFVPENNLRIARSYELLTSGLTALGITHYPAGSGIFIFANFQSLLRRGAGAGAEGGEITFEAERALHLALVRRARLSLTPGEACHHATPGYFRMCYCWVDAAAVQETLRRLRVFIDEEQQLWQQQQQQQQGGEIGVDSTHQNGVTDVN